MAIPNVSKVIFSDGGARFHATNPFDGVNKNGSVAGQFTEDVHFADLISPNTSPSKIEIRKVTLSINAARYPGGALFLAAVEPEDDSDDFWTMLCEVEESDQQRTQDFVPPTILLPTHKICLLHVWNPHSAGQTWMAGVSAQRSGRFNMEYRIVP